MEINIEQIMEGRKKHVKLEKDKYKALSKELKQAEGDEAVKRYLEKKRQLEAARAELKKKNDEYSQGVQEICTHPLLNLVYSKNYSRYETESYCIQCVLCGETIETPGTRHEKLRKLYDEKRLIASHGYEYDYWEGRGYNTYSPTLYTTEAIRAYYYELYLKMQKLKSIQIIGIETPSIEELVWEEFCGDKTKGKKHTKKL
ncbi:MAG: hypothetical protein IKF82_03355 [Bacilli bacterium]|nr:hypothetical protein [Bacilli bacterium]